MFETDSALPNTNVLFIILKHLLPGVIFQKCTIKILINPIFLFSRRLQRLSSPTRRRGAIRKSYNNIRAGERKNNIQKRPGKSYHVVSKWAGKGCSDIPRGAGKRNDDLSWRDWKNTRYVLFYPSHETTAIALTHGKMFRGTKTYRSAKQMFPYRLIVQTFFFSLIEGFIPN